MSKAADRTQRQLLELLKLPGNDVCADCRSRNPRWASWDHGIFICVQCAGIHRKMGTHISKVKSLTLDTWSREQVEHMRTHGNIKSNDLLNPGSLGQLPPSSADEGERESQLERFIRDKYEYRTLVGNGPPPPRSAPIASPSPTTLATAPLFAKPPTQPQRRGSSPAVSAPPPQPTRSSTTPLASTLALADEPTPTIPPRPFVNTPKNLTPSPEGVKHVRFRSTSVPIPDTDMPLRVPSAAGENRQPAKSILRPSSALSASASAPNVPSVAEEWRGMSWGSGGGGATGGNALGMGLPNGVQGQGRTPSSASTASFASMMSQGSAMSNGSIFSNGSTATTLSSLGGPSTSSYGGATNPFTGAPMSPGYQQQTTFGQPPRAFSSSPAPTSAPAPAPPPPQPQRLNSSIWDDLDFLGGVAPSSSSPAPPPQHSSTLFPPAPQHPPFASSTSPSQARTSSPFTAPPTSTSTYNPPSPAPLRPQLTGFVPSSQFGQQLASELPNPGSGSASAPFLRPQQTGYTSSPSLLSSSQRGSSNLSPLRPQQTGFAPPPSQSPLPNAPTPPSASPFAPLPSQQQPQNSLFPSQPQQPSPYQPQPSFLPSPSPSSFQPQQLQPQPTSTNPFHSSMLSPSPLSMGSLGSSLPQVQTAMQTGGGGGGGGTNPFFSSYQSQMQPLRPQATGMPMQSFGGGGGSAMGMGNGFGGGGGSNFGGVGGYGGQPQMQQPMPMGRPPQQQQQQQQFASTNPFFGFGGAAQGQQGQYGRPWGS